MKFDLTIDKNAEAVIDETLCINCGKCSRICPTDAIEEYSKTVYCMFTDCGQGKGRDAEAKYFREAKELAVESTCSEGCPLGIVPQSIAALVKAGHIDEAYKLIDERSPLPKICAAVCDNVCAAFCKRGSMIDTALNMKALEGYVLSRANIRPHKFMKRYNQHIAVIGGGPAGLSAALELTKAGYEAVIFEKDKVLGGALNWGIPDFRLKKELLAEETERVVSAGIQVRYGMEIGADYMLEDIWREGFSACIIAVGASEGLIPELPGTDAEMVYDGVSVMRQINGGEDEGLELGQTVAVIGNGEFAADTARMLKRQGRDVICASAANPEDMQLSQESIQAMKEEAIDFRAAAAPKQIISSEGRVKAVEFTNIEYIEDDRGVLKANAVKGSEFNIFCDSVVFAQRRRCNAGAIVNVETFPGGIIRVDDCCRTNKEGILACGDAAGRAGSVAHAMASGRRAAAEICRQLCGMRSSLNSNESVVKNAPDATIIYPENVPRIIPQVERTIKEGAPQPEERSFTEDIVKILRDAGIQEVMPNFPCRDSSAAMRKVAIIGGGIAGITAAIDLAEKGYAPTIMEKSPALGGHYRWFSSRGRIDKELMDRELEKIESSGISVIYNINAGAVPDIKSLFSMGFEAVIFAIGESQGLKPDMPNADCHGVFDIISLAGRLADNEEISGIGRQIIVSGSDEMTFDTAMTLRSRGHQVTVMSPREKGALRSCAAHVAAALDAGVNLVTGVELIGINQENGRLSGVKGKVTERGIVIDISCDSLVLGGTGRPDTEAIAKKNPELDIDDKGYIVADERLITSIYGVFAIGDFHMSAVEAGHAAASTADSFMKHEDIRKSAVLRQEEQEDKGASKYEIFEGSSGKDSGFETGRRILEAEAAKTEASRCLQCGYRREVGSRCIGCGICVSECPAGAVLLRPLSGAEAEEV